MDRIYELEGPDGEIYEIEGPENARESDLIDALQGYLAETAAASVAQSRIDEDKAFEDQLATDLRLAEAAKRKRLLDEEGFFSTAKKGIVEGYLGTGLTAAEGTDSDTLGSKGTTTDSIDTTELGISYAVASGVTANIGWLDKESSDEGNSEDSGGTSWYIGASMSF